MLCVVLTSVIEAVFVICMALYIDYSKMSETHGFDCQKARLIRLFKNYRVN